MAPHGTVPANLAQRPWTEALRRTAVVATAAVLTLSLQPVRPSAADTSAADVSAADASAVGAGSGRCDDRLKTVFRPDRNTTVLLVRRFAAGEPVALSNTPATPPPPPAPVDMCLVKLLVGPGNPGTPGAPSTSPGIGIEVWLPTRADWNRIIRSYGSGGWAGGVPGRHHARRPHRSGKRHPPGGRRQGLCR